MAHFKLIIIFFFYFISSVCFSEKVTQNNENVNSSWHITFKRKKNTPEVHRNCVFQKSSFEPKKCKSFEKERYDQKGNGTKIMYFIHRSPQYIKDIIDFRTLINMQKTVLNTITDIFVGNALLLHHTIKKVFRIYLKSKYRKNIKQLFRTFFIRFILVYILQLCSAFFSFHYFNLFSQKIQSDYNIPLSRSKIFSRVIGFFELNLINYYFNVFSEVIQIIFIRILFNKYETCVVKTFLYNSEDYLIKDKTSNKYVMLYFMVKKFFTSKVNKLSLFTSNYTRYLVATNLFFRLFDGRYNKYCPSDVKMPGVYADIKKSIEKDMKYATRKEIEILRNFCKKTGCHTCGKKCYEKFIGDHQPPVQVIKDTIEYYKNKKILLYFLKLFNLYDTKQRLYAQCIQCSQIQSVAVRCKKSKMVPHASTIRLFHFASIIHILVKMVFYTKWNKLFYWDDDSL